MASRMLLEGEQRLLPAVQADLNSLLQSVQDAMVQQRANSVEAAIFRQQSLAEVKATTMSDLHERHKVWCSPEDGSTSSKTAVGGAPFGNSTHNTQPQNVLYELATVGGYRIEVRGSCP